VITLSGFTGLKIGVPRVWAPPIADRGFVCLGIDFRGYGASEGLRGRVTPQDEVEDTRAAISFLETVPEVDATRIGLFGWAQGGSIAIVAAADDARVGAVAAINSQGDTGRVTRLLHSDASWKALQTKIAEDRRRRAVSGVSLLVDPFEILPLDLATDRIVREKLYQLPNYGTDVSLETAEAMLRFRAEDVVGRLAPRPLLLIHGGANMLHRPDESQRLFELAGEPKELVILEGKQHLDWTEDQYPSTPAAGGEPTTFDRVVEQVGDFFSAALR
jgi:pimeloyl-ACP methyl ester carboxylesterase